MAAGSTVHLFWSRQDTDAKLYDQTSTDLVNWTAKTQVGQSIGVPVSNVTSNFGITKLSSGSWLLGWVGTSAVGEGPPAPAGSLLWPVVKVATSSDLASWSTPIELNLPSSQRQPKSVAVTQDPSTSTLYSVLERCEYPPGTDFDR